MEISLENLYVDIVVGGCAAGFLKSLPYFRPAF